MNVSGVLYFFGGILLFTSLYVVQSPGLLLESIIICVLALVYEGYRKSRLGTLWN